MKTKLFTILFLAIGWASVVAQDISGKWTGRLTQNPGGFTQEYYFEMNLKQKENIISGTSFIRYTNRGRTYTGLMSVRGTFDGKYFYYEDLKVLNEKGMTDSTAWCIKKCRFAFKEKEGKYHLSGNWTGSTKFGYCSPGTINASKDASSKDTVVDGENPTDLTDILVSISTLDDEENVLPANLEIKEKGRGGQKIRSTGEYELKLEPGHYHVSAKASGYYDDAKDFVVKKGDTKLSITCKLKKIRKGDHFAIENLHFERSKATITQESKETLNKLVEFLEVNNEVKVQINGHTDNVGSKYLNRLLSYNRANAVVRFLVKNGILQSRLSAKGHGSEIPVADNNTKEGRAKNRRVEFEIIGVE